MREIKFRAWMNITNNMAYMENNETLWEFLRGVCCCELMQYTGIKDKNGVEIYDGDIVKGRYTTDMGEVSTIIWGDSSFCVYGVGQDGHKTGFACCPSEAKVLEVIGNIYESPELLEANK